MGENKVATIPLSSLRGDGGAMSYVVIGQTHEWLSLVG